MMSDTEVKEEPLELDCLDETDKSSGQILDQSKKVERGQLKKRSWIAKTHLIYTLTNEDDFLAADAERRKLEIQFEDTTALCGEKMRCWRANHYEGKRGTVKAHVLRNQASSSDKLQATSEKRTARSSPDESYRATKQYQYRAANRELMRLCRAARRRIEPALNAAKMQELNTFSTTLSAELAVNCQATASENQGKHHQVHTGDKTLTCAMCENEFRWLVQVNKHKRFASRKFLPDVNCAAAKQVGFKTFAYCNCVMQGDELLIDGLPPSTTTKVGKNSNDQEIICSEVSDPIQRDGICSMAAQVTLGQVETKIENNPRHPNELAEYSCPFRCSACGEPLTCRAKLIKHELGRICECGTRFACVRHLRDHQQLDCHLFFYICPICRLRFRQHHSRVRHVLNLHHCRELRSLRCC